MPAPRYPRVAPRSEAMGLVSATAFRPRVHGPVTGVPAPRTHTPLAPVFDYDGDAYFDAYDVARAAALEDDAAYDPAEVDVVVADEAEAADAAAPTWVLDELDELAALGLIPSTATMQIFQSAAARDVDAAPASRYCGLVFGKPSTASCEGGADAGQGRLFYDALRQLPPSNSIGLDVLRQRWVEVASGVGELQGDGGRSLVSRALHVANEARYLMAVAVALCRPQEGSGASNGGVVVARRCAGECCHAVLDDVAAWATAVGETVDTQCAHSVLAAVSHLEATARPALEAVGALVRRVQRFTASAAATDPIDELVACAEHAQAAVGLGDRDGTCDVRQSYALFAAAAFAAAWTATDAITEAIFDPVAEIPLIAPRLVGRSVRAAADRCQLVAKFCPGALVHISAPCARREWAGEVFAQVFHNHQGAHATTLPAVCGEASNQRGTWVIGVDVPRFMRDATMTGAERPVRFPLSEPLGRQLQCAVRRTISGICQRVDALLCETLTKPPRAGPALHSQAGHRLSSVLLVIRKFFLVGAWGEFTDCIAVPLLLNAQPSLQAALNPTPHARQVAGARPRWYETPGPTSGGGGGGPTSGSGSLLQSWVRAFMEHAGLPLGVAAVSIVSGAAMQSAPVYDDASGATLVGALMRVKVLLQPPDPLGPLVFSCVTPDGVTVRDTLSSAASSLWLLGVTGHRLQCLLRAASRSALGAGRLTYGAAGVAPPLSAGLAALRRADVALSAVLRWALHAAHEAMDWLLAAVARWRQSSQPTIAALQHRVIDFAVRLQRDIVIPDALTTAVTPMAAVGPYLVTLCALVSDPTLCAAALTTGEDLALHSTSAHLADRVDLACRGLISALRHVQFSAADARTELSASRLLTVLTMNSYWS